MPREVGDRPIADSKRPPRSASAIARSLKKKRCTASRPSRVRPTLTNMKLNGKKVLIVIPPTQFRHEVLFEPRKILQDEGATIGVPSIAARACRGMRGGTARAYISIADAKPHDYAEPILC